MFTHILVITYMLLKLIVHDNYIMLTPNWLSGASLQLLAVYLLSTLFGILIPAVCKVTESMVQLPTTVYPEIFLACIFHC